MGRAAGAGSPVWFMCPTERVERYDAHFSHGRTAVGQHQIVRTGRSRPYRSKRGSALGQRSLDRSHEFRCSCGYHGWTNHRSVLNTRITEDE